MIGVEELRVAGFNMNLVLVVDVYEDGNVVIGCYGWVYGIDGEVISVYVSWFIDVFNVYQVVCVIKYFLGYGWFCGDSYDGFVDIMVIWLEVEFDLFVWLINSGYVKFIMGGYLMY